MMNGNEFLNWLNTCKDCGKNSDDVRFGRCPECQKIHDMKISWEDTVRFVKVLMHKDEYNRYYKNCDGYDTASYPLDENYVYVYIYEGAMDEARKNHENYEKEFI